MSSKGSPRFKKQQLYQLFIDGLGDMVEKHSDITKAPLLVDLKAPYPLRLRVYLYNCTNPPGGRSIEEYKSQVILPGQKPRERGQLDYSDWRMPILAAYALIGENIGDGVFVLWDAYKHDSFAYSANMQVRAETILKTLSSNVAVSRRSNDEIVLAARPQHLFEAIRCRVSTLADDKKEASHELI